jgi:2-amino-4-hydroxy-6-hydroxymethyldihydropteridine diphosphokinase
VLSLGSNLGDRLARLRRGLEIVAMHLPVLAVSPVYETAPVGVEDQPAFLNVAAMVDSGDAEAVLVAAHATEESQGRLRSRRWGPRTLDVDVIAVDQQVSADPRLTLPHPRARDRAFVLVPWLDLDPQARLAGAGLVRDIVASLPPADLRRVADPLPLP